MQDARGEEVPAAEVVERLSGAYAARIGDGIGEGLIAEARFLDDRYIVFMDRFSPHLRLFTVDGDRLWVGAKGGGAPHEQQRPQALAVVGDTVFVFQRGRISRWLLDGDSLAFDTAMPLPPEYAPLGAVRGCNQDLLLYARNDRVFAELLGPESAGAVRADHLYSVTFPDGVPSMEPWWSAEGETSLSPYTGHTAVLIGRAGTTIAVHHRANAWAAGQLLQFDCSGRMLHSFSEQALATGESLPVHAPRTRALEWTGGIVAVPNGMAITMHRFYHPRFHGVDKQEWRTEIFRFSEGEYRGSIIIPGQWSFMDYHPELGILMTSNDPVPHFVRVPEQVLIAPSAEEVN